MAFNAFISGLFLGLSLIVAIGAQNAFILKQGLKKEYIFSICLICAVSDAFLITIGVLGFSVVITKIPLLEPIARYFGATFLLIYGMRSFYLSWKSNHALMPEGKKASSYKVVILTCLAFTWLNPNVYLDTLVLMGTISTHFVGFLTEFTIGAILASFIFFFSLGYGSRLLLPFFKKPISWKILEFLTGVIMVSIAIKLVF